MDEITPAVEPLPLGPFRLDVSRRELLTADGHQAPLRRQALLVLLALAERAGHVVDKDELIKTVWPGKFITDDSLVQAVGDIRRLLGPDTAGLLRTVARRGYLLEVTPPPSPALHNLPVQHTSFVGRETELAAAGGQLRHSRLLTLFGAAGAGKTRLAIQVAASAIGHFPDGVCWVELAPLADAAFLATAFLHALGHRWEGVREPQDMLIDHLKHKRLLLVADNCEHLSARVSDLAHRILIDCPGVKVLATSREVLKTPGESVFAVPPLTLPNAADSVSDSEAVRLFVDRASTARDSFALDAHNAPSIAQICIRLDGLPLAIELAAARVNVLTPEQIVPRLDDRFRLLTGGSRTLSPRQQTLRAAIDWSTHLLAPNERALLRRLCVFSGGCTLDAVEAVAPGAGLERADVLELLSQLINKSLVVARASGKTVRYSLLESVREYGAEELAEEGEVDLLRDRHLEYFRAMGELMEPRLHGAGQRDALRQVETEWDNIRAAMDWAAVAQRHESGLRLAKHLGRYWGIRGDFSEGRRWLQRMLNVPGAAAHTTHCAWAYYFEGYLAWFQADLASMQSALEQSLQMARSSGNRRCEAYALDFLGVIPMSQGDDVSAHRCFAESQAIMREVGDLWGVAFTHWHVGMIHHERADHAAALSEWVKAHQILDSMGDTVRGSMTLGYIAFERLRSGDATQSFELLRQCVRVAVDQQAKFQVASYLWAFGELAERERKPQVAERLYLAGLGVYESIGSLRSMGASLLELGRAKRWYALHKERVDIALVEGHVLSVAAAIDLAMTILPGIGAA